MPLDDDYKDQLKSAFADLPNIGTRYGGAITAAYFLKEFADPTPWVHLDIAGTAWLDEAKTAYGERSVGHRGTHVCRTSVALGCMNIPQGVGGVLTVLRGSTRQASLKFREY